MPISSRLMRGQAAEVLLLGQHLGLEGLQAGGQRRTPLPDLLRADQSEGRILAQPLGVIEILVARQAAVHRLPQQVGKGQLSVLTLTRIRQVLFDQIAETQPLVQLPHQNQAAIGSDPRSLEIDLQGGVERQLKGLILFFTHWVSSSGASSLHSNPYEY